MPTLSSTVNNGAAESAASIGFEDPGTWPWPMPISMLTEIIQTGPKQITDMKFSI